MLQGWAWTCLNLNFSVSTLSTEKQEPQPKGAKYHELDNMIKIWLSNHRCTKVLGKFTWQIPDRSLHFLALSSMNVGVVPVFISKLYSPPTATRKILNKSFCEAAKLVLTSECPSVLKTRSALPEAMRGNVLKRNLFQKLDYHLFKQGLFELFEVWSVCVFVIWDLCERAWQMVTPLGN